MNDHALHQSWYHEAACFLVNVLEIMLARTARNTESLNTPVTKYINRTKRKQTGKIKGTSTNFKSNGG